jgi:hypothetical protein
MLIASKRIPGGAGLAPVLVRRAATLELDGDTRQKSRFDAVDSQGRHIRCRRGAARGRRPGRRGRLADRGSWVDLAGGDDRRARGARPPPHSTARAPG